MILGKEAPSGQIEKHPEFPRMNPRLKPLYVISILTSLTLCLHMFKELSDGEAHPLDDEWEAIEREFYRYYLLEGKVPEDLGFLPEESKQIMEIYQSQFGRFADLCGVQKCWGRGLGSPVPGLRPPAIQ